jgi:hypothetical protein
LCLCDSQDHVLYSISSNDWHEYDKASSAAHVRWTCTSGTEPAPLVSGLLQNERAFQTSGMLLQRHKQNNRWVRRWVVLEGISTIAVYKARRGSGISKWRNMFQNKAREHFELVIKYTLTPGCAMQLGTRKSGKYSREPFVFSVSLGTKPMCADGSSTGGLHADEAMGQTRGGDKLEFSCNGFETMQRWTNTFELVCRECNERKLLPFFNPIFGTTTSGANSSEGVVLPHAMTSTVDMSHGEQHAHQSCGKLVPSRMSHVASIAVDWYVQRSVPTCLMVLLSNMYET